ncbi:hypothetical protein CR513_52747, partial [Mucuna pruriens]
MPQQPILFCEVFDVCGIDFMRPFQISKGNSYIPTRTNNAKAIVSFLKSKIFCKFGVLKALISDQGSHFYNKTMSTHLEKYGVIHRVVTTYHPQTNGQVLLVQSLPLQFVSALVILMAIAKGLSAATPRIYTIATSSVGRDYVQADFRFSFNNR